MALKEPESMDECVYFTRRKLDEKGSVMAWVSRKECPKCGKAMMGKPKGENGKIKIRSEDYECPACKYSVSKEEYEPTLECSIKYTCPHCGKSGEAAVPYKRKSFMGTKAIVFECGSCKEKIGITKKLADVKKK